MAMQMEIKIRCNKLRIREKGTRVTHKYRKQKLKYTAGGCKSKIRSGEIRKQYTASTFRSKRRTDAYKKATIFVRKKQKGQKGNRNIKHTIEISHIHSQSVSRSSSQTTYSDYR